MEFSIWCPSDGTVEVGLEDIDSIIVRSGSDVEVIFVCPVCGERISLAAQVPHALLASLDEAWVQIDGDEPRLITLRREGASAGSEEVDEEHAIEERVLEEHDDEATESRIEAYCEYFRRELTDADTVEKVLSEIDARELR
jgi:hypothetical protein